MRDYGLLMLEQCLNAVTASNGIALSLFIGGLFGSITHCAFMCAPFVIAQTHSEQNLVPLLQRLNGYALLPYHLGRITTYIFLGIIFSSILNLAYLFSPLKLILTAPLLMLAGLMFLTSAFPKLVIIFPWVQSIKFPIPARFITGVLSKLSTKMPIFQRYFMGVLLGFIPCGLVISALMATASTGDPFKAAIGMLAFGIGTIPALIGVAIGGNIFKKALPNLSNRLRQGFMLGSALWLFILASQALIYS